MRDYDPDIPDVSKQEFSGDDRQQREEKRFWKRHYRKKQRQRDRQQLQDFIDNFLKGLK